MVQRAGMFLVVALLLLACGGDDDGGTATATAPTTAPTATTVPPTASTAASLSDTGTSTSTTTATPVLEVVASGAGHDYEVIAWALIVRNPSTTVAISGATYTIIINEGDPRFEVAAEGVIPDVQPGEEMAVSDWTAFTTANLSISSVEAAVSGGEAVAPAPLEGLTFSFVEYDRATVPFKLTGTVARASDAPTESLLVSAVCIDAAGDIAGSGSTTLDAPPAGGPTEFTFTGWCSDATTVRFFASRS